MNPPDLPPDLAEWELRLRQRASQEPAPGFRQRVLAAVACTLNQEAGRPEGSFWTFAAATAAAALLAINFSISAANDTDWSLVAAIDSGEVDRAADQIQHLAPETSRREARRLGLLLQAQSRFAVITFPGPLCSLWEREAAGEGK